MKESQQKADFPSHFKGKKAIEHVVEAQSEGIIAMAESHGTELPGHWSAAADACRETALISLLIWVLLNHFSLENVSPWLGLVIFSLGWVIWKGGRSAWLGWQRLERLHRLMQEEGWEIQHHRQQEREELTELYAAKGFKGKLLEDVIDVLMADDDRLLKVMLEEEMGLRLKSLDHPLKQCLGAITGSALSALFCLMGAYYFGFAGLSVIGLSLLGIGGGMAASYEKNEVIPAVVWSMALGALSFGIVYFLMDFVRIRA